MRKPRHSRADKMELKLQAFLSDKGNFDPTLSEDARSRNRRFIENTWRQIQALRRAGRKLPS